jgi:hypothetical protein
MPEPTRSRHAARPAAAALVLILALALASVPGVQRLLTGATFTSSTDVAGNVIGPRACTSAGAWNTAVAGTSGLADWIRFAETTGTTAADSAGGTAWNYTGTVTRGLSGALFCQAAPLGNAVDPATTTARLVSPSAGSYPSALGGYASGLTTAVWFKGSTSTEAGRLLGLGDSTGAGSSTTRTDRVLWVDAAGTLSFGTIGGTLLASGPGYLDGRWHLAAVTMTSTSAVLYVDGGAVASTSSPAYYAFTGNVYWRVGYDASVAARRPATAPTAPFTGLVDEVVIARSAQTAAAVTALWRAGSAP